MAKVIQEKRKYQRILPSESSVQTLEEKGYEWVYSSNVSAIANRGKDLIIRFHNGSVYSYSNQAKNYERMMAAASKGKWVWRFLIRPKVPYRKIGSLPLAEDTTETDEEIVQPRIPTHEIKAIVPEDHMETGELPKLVMVKIKPLTTEAPKFPPVSEVPTRDINTEPQTLNKMQEAITRVQRVAEEPYFQTNKAWYYADEETGELKIRKEAPKKAQESYKKYMEDLKASKI
jgi:hypothetical protein